MENTSGMGKNEGFGNLSIGKQWKGVSSFSLTSPTTLPKSRDRQALAATPKTQMRSHYHISTSSH